MIAAAALRTSQGTRGAADLHERRRLHQKITMSAAGRLAVTLLLRRARMKKAVAAP
jgi:hypothetical protein